MALPAVEGESLCLACPRSGGPQPGCRRAILRTPAVEAPKLSALSAARIFVKYENMQATGSFKERGALLKLLTLDDAARQRGVIAISAGNHAQAVAYHAARLAIPATIVMPEHTPFNKVGNTEGYGAKVILFGETVAESRTAADGLIAEHGFTLIHPYDDPVVIAGQGTAGLEFVQDCADLDCMIVPIGGGGFIAGVATAVKALRPAMEIVGVEVETYASTYAALRGEIAECGGATFGGRHRRQNLRRSHAAHHSRACLGCNPRERDGCRAGHFHACERAENRCRRRQRGRARRGAFQ